MPSVLERKPYQHVSESIVLIVSACCCMSAIHAVVTPVSWTWYVIGAAAIAALTLLPLRFARMLAPAPCGQSTDRAFQGKKKLLVVLGTGGHTSEMILLLKNLDRSLYAPVTYVYTNDFCRRTVTAAEKLQRQASPPPRFRWIPRSRAVKQSWISTVFTTLASLPRSLWVVLSEFPDVLVVNGPGVCMPIAAAVVVLNLVVGKVRACVRVARR